jgi:hypothetical protein
MIPFFKQAIVTAIIFSLIICSCNTICFYENIEEEDVFVVSDKITESEIYVRFTYLEQQNLLPWSDFKSRFTFPHFGKDDDIHVTDAIYDIYTLDEKLIKPAEKRIDIAAGEIENIYKYSIFFLEK